jgi:RNA 2',3'-cyclic 3'-phosphodiesterase
MSRGATARLFVAVDVPSPVRARLTGWARSAAAGLESAGRDRPLRLLDPDSLHLTMLFLGSRPVGEIAAIGSALEECAVGVGELSVGAPLWLPPARPRSLAVAMHDEGGGLSSLHTRLTRAIGDATGWEPERRRFRAHVTLARTRGRVRPRAGARNPLGEESHLPATPQLRFTAASMTLYRSWLSPGGATYEALAACALPRPGP